MPLLHRMPEPPSAKQRYFLLTGARLTQQRGLGKSADYPAVELLIDRPLHATAALRDPPETRVSLQWSYRAYGPRGKSDIYIDSVMSIMEHACAMTALSTALNLCLHSHPHSPVFLIEFRFGPTPRFRDRSHAPRMSYRNEKDGNPAIVRL